MRKTHFYRRTDAVTLARAAVEYLDAAITACHQASETVKQSGYMGASIGIRQASLRLESWRDKVIKDIDLETRS